MTIKDFTESLISTYLEKSGKPNPDITLDIFKMIEGSSDLKEEYNAVCDHYPSGRYGVNQNIGKRIREHFDFVNDKTIPVKGECSLINSYTRFRSQK